MISVYRIVIYFTLLGQPQEVSIPLDGYMVQHDFQCRHAATFVVQQWKAQRPDQGDIKGLRWQCLKEGDHNL
jgi:hypothetical protein